MVAIRGSRLPALRSALGPAAAEVLFVDMTELGHNPARIIPGWRRFLDERCVDDQPVRGVGEPIWAGRRPAEVAEAQLHEALLNVAVDPDTPMWLRCPYDMDVADRGRAGGGRPQPPDPGRVRRPCAAPAATAGCSTSRTCSPPSCRSRTSRPRAIALPAAPAEVAALVGRHAQGAGLAAERAGALVAGPAGADRSRDTRLPAADLDRAGRAGLRGLGPRPVDDPLAGRVPARRRRAGRARSLAGQPDVRPGPGPLHAEGLDGPGDQLALAGPGQAVGCGARGGSSSSALGPSHSARPAGVIASPTIAPCTT